MQSDILPLLDICLYPRYLALLGLENVHLDVLTLDVQYTNSFGYVIFAALF